MYKASDMQLCRNISVDLQFFNRKIQSKLLQKLSSYLKFKKFAKNFKIKVSKICSTVVCISAHRSCVPSFVKIRQKL